MAEHKVDLGLLKSDDAPLISKDQATSENSIPLSPQWLNLKPSESKFGFSTALGDARSPNSLPQGNSSDSIHKDVWRLGGSQDKREWKKNVPDIESTRRWREEERETGLLGRREHRKEGDNGFRKNRLDNISLRETADPRTLPSGRNSGHENRRDTKWSSRWGGLDDKEDSRTEKRIDADKEDLQIEKQSIISGNRLFSESDSRDKWRPRHRQEILSSGSAVYRAAPGFGTERGRVEGSIVGFAPGRGRSNLIGSLPFSRSSSSTGPIGAVHISKSESLHDTFCYPRGKLLDIYRKNKILPSFDTIPEGLEDVPPITLPCPLMPLAFVKPDLEEVAVLEDIRKVKLTSSEDCDNSNGKNIAEVGEHEIGSDVGECRDKTSAVSIGMDFVDKASMPSKDDIHSIPASVTLFEQKIDQTDENYDGQFVLPDSLNDPKFGAVNRAASFDEKQNPTNNVNSSFDPSSIQEISGSKSRNQSINSEAEHLGQNIYGDLSLFYLDPEGTIQGPFFVEDIVTWHGEGYFGLDLPVCFSDAPEGTPFRKLGEVIPNLSLKPQPEPRLNPGDQFNPSADTRGHIDGNTLPSEFSYSMNNDQQWVFSRSEGPSDPVHPLISEHEDSTLSHYEKRPLVSDGIGDVGIQTFNSFSGYDSKEVSSSIKPASSIQNLSNDINNPSLSGHQYPMSEMEDHMNQKIQTGNDLNPLGLSWSELEWIHQKGPLSSNIGGVGDRAHTFNPPVGTNIPLFSRENEEFRIADDFSVGHDAWSSNLRRNSSQNVLHGDMNAGQISRFDLEQLRSQIFQKEKEKLQQQQLMSLHQNRHLTGDFHEHLQGPMHRQLSMNNPIPDMEMEHFLKLQFEQQRHFQLQQQQEQQLQQQQEQQLRHHMQLLQQQQQQQLLIEQLQHQQLHEQAFYKEQLLQELQQQAHHLSRNPDQSLEQFIQAKLGNNLRNERRNEVLDALSHPGHRDMLSMEQQFHLDPISTRHQPGMDEERHVGGVWSVDESGRFIRSASNSHQIRSNLQLPQRASSFEQPNHLERSFRMNDRMERGNYEPTLDHRNALTRIQELEMLKHHAQMGQFHSGSSSNQHWMSNQFGDSHLDTMGDSQLTQLHLAIEKQRREMRANHSSGHPMTSQVANDEISNRWLADLLHQKQVLQPSQPLGMINDRDSSWFSVPHATDHPGNLIIDKVGLGDSFRENSLFTNIGQAQERLTNTDMDGKANIFDGRGGRAFQSTSGALLEENPYFSDMGEIQREQLVDSMVTHLPRERIEFSDFTQGMMSKKHGSIGTGMSKSVLETQECGVEDAVNVPIRHSSFGSNGGGISLYNYETGANSLHLDERVYDRMSGIFSKGGHTLSSQGALSELVPAATPMNEGMQDASNVAPSSSKREMRFHRTSSTGDASNAPEASFVDMLKSTKKPGPEPDASMDFTESGVSGRSGRKKGKKGKQIDPSLLGFKVHSNRILMGEIHRPDD